MNDFLHRRRSWRWEVGTFFGSSRPIAAEPPLPQPPKRFLFLVGAASNCSSMCRRNKCLHVLLMCRALKEGGWHYNTAPFDLCHVTKNVERVKSHESSFSLFQRRRKQNFTNRETRLFCPCPKMDLRRIPRVLRHGVKDKGGERLM